MKNIKRLDTTEIIFKVISYTFLTIFAIFCLYPFIYAVSCAISGYEAVDQGKIILLPIDPQFKAFTTVFSMNTFWVSYSNTLFLTVFGTVFSMVTSIYGAYALSKKRLPFVRVLNFLLVFTMWFTAGLFATKLNYIQTRGIFRNMGITDDKWLVVIAMGVNAYNIILLRNGFAGVPKEIEEAALVDGATEFQIANKVYIPMSKATIATVALFYGISRWNGYFWAAQVIDDPNQIPLQVYIKKQLEPDPNGEGDNTQIVGYAKDSLAYCMIVSAIVPIIIIYPFIQKYFAAGVNLGGVKE